MGYDVSQLNLADIIKYDFYSYLFIAGMRTT